MYSENSRTLCDDSDNTSETLVCDGWDKSFHAAWLRDIGNDVDEDELLDANLDWLWHDCEVLDDDIDDGTY